VRILKLVYNRLKRRNVTSQPSWPKLPVLVASSLEEARSMETGYNHPKLPGLIIHQAKLHREEFGRYAQEGIIPGDRRFFQHFWVFEKIKATGIRKIYEVGGAGGNWALIINAYFQQFFDSWIIQEQPLVVEAANYSGWASDSRIIFSATRTISGGETAEAAYFCQGTLQFLPDPEEELRWAFSQQFAWLYFSRTLLVENRPERQYLVQQHYLFEHAPGLISPEEGSEILRVAQTTLTLAEFLACVPDTYALVFQTDEINAFPASQGENPVRLKEMGLLFRRKSTVNS
jgi:hypothetical protein